MGSSEVSDLESLDQDLKRDIETAARILKEEGAKEVYLFGSAAKGKLRPDSDIDLAVRGLPPERFYHAGGQVMFAVSRPVDVIDLDERNLFTEFLEREDELVRVA
jgi:predicted nucleotidyltransferase